MNYQPDYVTFFANLPPDLQRPLNSRESKKYTEVYALYTMWHFFPQISSDLIHSDCPDLQDIKSSFGVEVTKAVFSNAAQINGEFTKYRLGHKSEEDFCELKRLVQKNDGKVSKHGMSIIYPPVSSDDELELIRKSILKKADKFHSYRKNGFRKLGLFVVYDSPFIPVKSEKITQMLNDSVGSYNGNLNLLFLCDSVSLRYYETKSGDYKVIHYDSNVRDSISRRAFLDVIHSLI